MTITSTQKILDDRIKNYVLTCIDSGAYDVETSTVKEKIDFLMGTFESEHGFMVNRIGQVNALKEWLQGLPSVFNCVFYNYDVYRLGLKLGFLKHDANDRAVEKFNDHYWHLLANKILQLSRNYRVPIQANKKHNVKVIYDDHDHCVTWINGTENDVLRHYIGESFTKSDESKHKCIAIEFLPTKEG